MCSNIGCRVVTSGPADDPNKAVGIGEAAHIYGAKAGSARFRHDMTDGARAEITMPSGHAEIVTSSCGPVPIPRGGMFGAGHATAMRVFEDLKIDFEKKGHVS